MRTNLAHSSLSTYRSKPIFSISSEPSPVNDGFHGIVTDPQFGYQWNVKSQGQLFQPLHTDKHDRKSPIEIAIFNALSEAKIWTSRVAMHLERSARDRYFKQLDRLHEIDEWLENQAPLALDSYKGFIRFMLLVNGASKPSLGFTESGHLIASWSEDSDRLVVEFLDKNNVEWLVREKVGEIFDRTAGRTTISRLLNNLSPYRPDRWLKN